MALHSVNPNEPMLTARDVAAWTGMSLKRIYKLTDEHLPHVRIGRTIRYPRTLLEAWLQAGGSRTE